MPNKVKVALVVLAFALLGLGWAIFGFLFTLGFLLLTVAYTVTAYAVACVIAWWYDEQVSTYAKNNNTYFFLGCGMTAITFVIALFNFGPAILLPETTPSLETRGTLNYFFSHLWLGKGATSTTPTNPLPWATGTWFWWKAFVLYFILTLGYIPIAFWDEVNYAFTKVVELIRNRHLPTPGLPGQTPAPAGGHTHGPTATGHSFSELLKVEFIVEIVTEFLKYFWERRRRP